MIRVTVLMLALIVLDACGKDVPKTAPPPPPVVEALPVPPLPPVVLKAPGKVVELRASYADAARRLRAYLAQDPCLPSGPTDCVDHDQVRVANEAQRVAHDALAVAERRAAAVHVATLRVAAFQAVMSNLGQ